MDIVSPQDMMQQMVSSFLLTALAIIPPAVTEFWSARRGLYRPLAVAIVAIMVLSVVLRLFAMGPHGPALQPAVPTEHAVVHLLLSPGLFGRLLLVYGSALAFLLSAFAIAFWRGERRSAVLRLLAVSPFVYYICHALLVLKNFKAEVW